MKRILVANRGEIAVRILRGAKRRGYETVAVYSDADAGGLHVREADVAVHLGAMRWVEPHLSERLLQVAAGTGADAIHPGYGFLSENAAFARAVTDAGLTFIGPSASAIDAMGDKSAAKARMIAAGVPCIPGFHGVTPAEQTDEHLTERAAAVGYPLMIKAAAGGGGRGMRVVHDASTLLGSLRAARSEALSSFGDSTLLLERALVGARHVEIQVLGDRHGTILHLGERDCSIQRRNQKVVEECPSPAVDAELRARMGEVAVRAARSVDYVGAGTVEFMLDATGTFYFLEMNTRLQVEHPVTELVYGIDLVEWQLRIAEGEPLAWTQAEMDARRSGHAIEVRLCAEDASFRPRTGKVLRWQAPEGQGVRIDTFVETGTVVSAQYDSMLGKIIAHGADREEARRRLLGALRDTTVLGIDTNRDVLRRIVENPVFASGQFGTDFIGRHFEAGEAPLPAHLLDLAAITLELDDALALRRQHGFDPALSGWQSGELASSPVVLEHGETTHTIRIERRGKKVSAALPHELEGLAGVGGTRSVVGFENQSVVDDGTVRYRFDGQDRVARFVRDGDRLWLDAEGVCTLFIDRTHAPVLAADQAASGAIRARSDGKIARVDVAVGDRVEKGHVLCVLESMKMEFELVSPHAGVVAAVHVSAGEQVQAKRLLCEITPQENSPNPG